MHTLVIAETPSNAYKTPEIMPSPQSEHIFMHIAASENSFMHVPDSTMDSAPASRKPEKMMIQKIFQFMCVPTI